MRKNETSHFYLGRAIDSTRLSKFLAEDYENVDEGLPISEFCASQDELFCNHDFMESGFRKPGVSLKDFFAPHSYANQWSEAISLKANALKIEDANVLIFITNSEVKSPKSIKLDGLELIYLGEIEYLI